MMHRSETPQPQDWLTRHKAKVTAALFIFMPILSMLAGAAYSAYQHGIL